MGASVSYVNKHLEVVKNVLIMNSFIDVCTTMFNQPPTNIKKSNECVKSMQK